MGNRVAPGSHARSIGLIDIDSDLQVGTPQKNRWSICIGRHVLAGPDIDLKNSAGHRCDDTKLFDLRRDLLEPAAVWGNTGMIRSELGFTNSRLSMTGRDLILCL